MRQYVVGDIHGGYRALKDVLQQANFDYENDKLISIGDICDGWSEVKECIEELMKIKNLEVCTGNHDQWSLLGLVTEFHEVLRTDEELWNKVKQYYNPHFFKMTGHGRHWLPQGGRSTLIAYENDMDSLKKHVEFLADAHLYYIDNENRYFSHAGGIDVEINPETVAKYDKDQLFWDRTFWQKAYKGRKPGANFLECYIGHTPTINYPSNKEDCSKPINRANVWNMDTGACYTGPMSLMNLETKELFQSKRVMEYYPNELGRNENTHNHNLKLKERNGKKNS